jgi:predicted glycosyltransferase involved in capsule biosynthesis
MISFIAAVMNREENLMKMLPTWTQVDKIKDFVIVDWTSAQPIINNPILKEQMEKYKNIKVLRVEGQTHYNRSMSWNLAAKYTDPKNKIMLKLDADCMNIDSSWLKFQCIKHEELFNYFICGDPFFNPCSVGFLLVNKRNFNDINGYNENILPMWGYEDEDLYHRLSKSKGLRHPDLWEHEMHNPEFKKIIFFDFDKYIYHIPHSNSFRVNDSLKINNHEFSDEFLNSKLVHRNFIMRKQTEINWKISKEKPTWISQRYNILEENNNYTRLEMI